MKNSSLLRGIAAAFLLTLAGLANAQTAALKSDATTLIASGGVVTLTASVAYDGQPAAVGWALATPAGWSLVSVGGPNAPQIAPVAGASGDLEFAYTSAPEGKAEFTVVLRYPAGTTSGKIAPTVLVRAAGKLVTLTPAAVVLGK